MQAVVTPDNFPLFSIKLAIVLELDSLVAYLPQASLSINKSLLAQISILVGDCMDH